MICSVCGEPTRVLYTRERKDHFLTRRRECPGGHRTTTYEIPEGAFSTAYGEIQKYLSRRPYVQRQIALKFRQGKMQLDRSIGMTCQQIADKYKVSLHMARYYTRLPRARVYPAAKAHGA